MITNKWLREKFGFAVIILFYIFIVSWAILGYKVGLSWANEFPYIEFFIAFIFGIIGFLLAILIYGFAATVVHISETNDEILEKLEDFTKNSSKNAVLSNRVSSTAALNTNASSSSTLKGDVWVCSKCGATNPNGSRLCQNCGH